jgi:hypothetical protein
MSIIQFPSLGPPFLVYEIFLPGPLVEPTIQQLPYLQPTCVADVPLLRVMADESTPHDFQVAMDFYTAHVNLFVNSQGMACQPCDGQGGVGICGVSLFHRCCNGLTQVAQNLARGQHITTLGGESAVIQ